MIRMQWTASYDGKGNVYGYTTHQKNLRAALERHGVIIDDDADIAVHICTPPSFRPIPGKFNILYTMYEANSLPPTWPGMMEAADLVIVPCTHNRELMRREGIKAPIKVVWEGFNEKRYHLKRRRRPPEGERMLFLWVGAANPRKGWEYAAYAWETMLHLHPEMRGRVMLYLKTTQPEREPRILRSPNFDTILDTRDWPMEELIALYERAHVFVFPSLGEGWGLTLHEAMATGMPAIYTPFSAMTDWVPAKHAYPIKFSMQPITILKTGTNMEYAEGFHPQAARPDTEHLARLMYHVWRNYDEAAHRGYYAGVQVRKITWDRSAREFIDKVMPHYEATMGREEAA